MDLARGEEVAYVSGPFPVKDPLPEGMAEYLLEVRKGPLSRTVRGEKVWVPVDDSGWPGLGGRSSIKVAPGVLRALDSWDLVEKSPEAKPPVPIRRSGEVVVAPSAAYVAVSYAYMLFGNWGLGHNVHRVPL